MELQFEKNTMDCLRQAAWEVKNEEQTQEVKLSESMPDVGRVLGAWGQILLRGKEWRGSGMSVSGGVMAWVLYEPEDGSDVKTVETWIPFQLRWDFPETKRDGAIVIRCLLRGVDARAVGARKLMVRAVMSVAGEALEPIQAEVYSAGGLPEDVQILKKSYPIRMPREAGERAFTLEEELSIPAEVDTVIAYDLHPRIQEQKVMAGRMVFRGSALLHMLYRGTDGVLATFDQELSISQYTELEREYGPDCEVRIIPAVTELDVDKQGDGRMWVKAGLVGQYILYDRPVLEIVEDAYSPGRNVEVKCSQSQIPMILEDQTVSLRAEGELEAAAGRAVDAKLMLSHPAVRRKEADVSMDMDGAFQLLYYDEEGKLQWGTAPWELSQTMPAGEDTQTGAELWPEGRCQASLGGDRAVLQCELSLRAVTKATQGLSMVTGLELGDAEELDPGRPSLILRKCGKDSLWDLAKRCGTTVDAICEANSLEGEPDQDRILLIPVS